MLRKRISRRQFVKLLLSGFAALAFSNGVLRSLFAKSEASSGRRKSNIRGDYDLVLASGTNPYQMTVQAIEGIGGMSRFVKKGNTVVIKPNISWDRAPEYAANTNPLVVAALVELCFKAGARRVNVFDRSCNSATLCYANSGIKKAAKEKGAAVYFVNEWNFVKAGFKYKSPMEGWPIFRDAVECDTFINVPVLKHHGLTRLTLSMKNLMGVCGGNRGNIHQDIGRKVVDIADFINPDLTVIDAFRVLIRHGPSGGDLNDVQQVNKLIVATDPTLADTYACTLMREDPLSIPYISEAIKRNFGNSDINMSNILELSV